MKRLALLLGRIAYSVCYPFLAVYLSKDHRTRVIIQHQNQVLLIRSWMGNGDWDLPGGGLHKREDPLQGALREVCEEIGLELTSEQTKPLYAAAFRSGLIRYQAHYFQATLIQKPALKLQRLEVADARWHDVHEVPSQRLHPDLKKAISQIHE